jgi:cyanophycin synthetase
VAAVAGLVAAPVAFFSLEAEPPPLLRAHVEAGGRAYLVRRRMLVEVEAGETRPLVAIDEIPATLGGLARHNVANALAAAGGARALGATIEQVGEGLRDFQPSADRSPGRLNLFRHGKRVVIVDFAHNEAGLEALLDVADGIAAGGAARTWPVTLIVGTAGDRPDDSIRGIGRVAGARAQRIAIKETPSYLRGRDGGEMIDLLRAGIAEGAVEAAARGLPAVDPAAVPVHETEVAALRAELALAGGPDERGRPDQPAVVALMCHAEREDVFALLADLGARPVHTPAELRALVPRLAPRRHRA